MSWNRGGWWVVVVLGCACGSGARQRLEVRGSDLSGTYVHLDVMVGGQPVKDARVEIDGQVIPFVGDRYSGELATPVEAGGILSLEVSRGGSTVTGTGRVPAAPVLIAPSFGMYVSSGEDLVVRWTSATSPDAFVVSAQWSCGPDCGTSRDFEAPGSARSLTIPAGVLPAGTVTLSLRALNDGTLSGDYEPAETYPGMNIRGEAQPVDLTVGEAPSRTVSGTVSGAGAGVVIRLVCVGASPREVATGADGSYALGGVPAASCTVTPSGEGYAFEPASATLPAGTQDQPGVDFLAQGLLAVQGRAITANAANVEVMHAGQPVEDAAVRINGQSLTWLPGPSVYHLDWPTPLSSGAVLSLSVTTAWASVTGTAVLPETPTLTAPDPGALPPGEDVLVEWTSATAPDGFFVMVSWSPTSSPGLALGFPAASSARSLSLPADQLPSGAMRITVLAANDGQLTGDYDPSALGPGMDVISESPAVWVSR